MRLVDPATSAQPPPPGPHPQPPVSTPAPHLGPQCTSAARTASGVCAASAVIFMERLPQGLYDAQTGRPPRWEETSDNSHHDAECDAEQQQEGGYAEAKGNLAEARPVGRTRHDAVDGECE